MGRNEYILYRRASGGKGGKVFYVAFWDAEAQRYTNRRSTGKTAEGEADNQARRWLKDGVPLRKGHTFYGHLEEFWEPGSPYLKRKAGRGKVFSAAYVENARRGIEKYVLPWLDGANRRRLPIEGVTAQLLEDLIAYLSSTGLGPSRVNGIVKAVRVVLSEAHRLGEIQENPAKRVEKLADKPPARDLLTAEEVRKIFAPEWKDKRYRAANLLAATTGMRLGEIRGLQAGDIVGDEIRVCHNWQDREADGEKLKAPKWGSTRKVPVPSRTLEALHELVGSNPWGDGFVFWGHTRGKPPSTTVIEDSFYAALRAIGITEEQRKSRGLSFHQWRHWFNSVLRGRVSDHALRLLTGHSSEAMQDHYTEITDEQRREVKLLAEGLVEQEPGVGTSR
jgi:integrase